MAPTPALELLAIAPIFVFDVRQRVADVGLGGLDLISGFHTRCRSGVGLTRDAARNFCRMPQGPLDNAPCFLLGANGCIVSARGLKGFDMVGLGWHSGLLDGVIFAVMHQGLARCTRPDEEGVALLQPRIIQLDEAIARRLARTPTEASGRRVRTGTR
jgi:hypothetical protein